MTSSRVSADCKHGRMDEGKVATRKRGGERSKEKEERAKDMHFFQRLCFSSAGLRQGRARANATGMLDGDEEKKHAWMFSSDRLAEDDRTPRADPVRGRQR